MGLQDPAAVEEDMDGAINTILTIFYRKLFHSIALNLFSMSVSLHINIVMEFIGNTSLDNILTLNVDPSFVMLTPFPVQMYIFKSIVIQSRYYRMSVQYYQPRPRPRVGAL